MQLPSAPDHCVGTDLSHLREDAASCRRCPLWRNATRTVFGEGPASATMMLVGEQPGDREEQAARPFIGPAGQILDQALEAAGIDRATVYITNAVKHFKNEPRGVPSLSGGCAGKRSRASRGTCGLRSTRPTSCGSLTRLRANANLCASSKTWKALRPFSQAAASAHPDRGDKRRSGRYKRSLSPRGR
jgi:hypothetical protein